MDAVVGAGVNLRQREFGLAHFDDPVGLFGLVDAHRDDARVRRAGRAQNVEPRAVAVIDLEAEARRVADALHVVVDHGDVHAPGEQHLHRDLAEAAEADDERRAGEPFGRRLGGRRLAGRPHFQRQLSSPLAASGPASMVSAASAVSDRRLLHRQKSRARRKREDDE